MNENPLTFSVQTPLEELLKLAGSKFKVRFEPIKIGGYELEVLQLENLEEYVDQLAETTKEDKKIELPFWAKIWPTSILLGHFISKHLSKIKSSDANLLEIGAGIGVCGLIAAKQGYQVTISDINEDALLFNQINILKNNLQNSAQIAKVDFTQQNLDNRFSVIIGSEVLYINETYRPLIKFLLSHIRHNENSEILLAKDYKISAKKFFKLAQDEFYIQENTLGFKERVQDNNSLPERHLCHIYKLKPKKYD